jgi:hypothetical protein
LILLLVDGHAARVTPRVIPFAVSRKIFMFQLVPHLSVVGLVCFRSLQDLGQKRQKLKRMKGETLTIYRVMHTFYKATIVPMVNWRFMWAVFGRLTVP